MIETMIIMLYDFGLGLYPWLLAREVIHGWKLWKI